jgi:hypothetical protein
LYDGSSPWPSSDVEELLALMQELQLGSLESLAVSHHPTEVVM